jgi:hypothetical protein
MSLRNRFKRVVDLARAKGFTGQPGFCWACRERHGRMVVVVRRQEVDGRTSPVIGEVPEPCSVCGQVPETMNEIVEVIVDSPSKARAALKQMREG